MTIQSNFKSTRLLVQAINVEMESIRKSAMGNVGLPFGPLNELRDLINLLAERAERLAVDDVPNLSPTNYVATMKPLVAMYHRALINASSVTLAACLCEDLEASACVVILIGNDKTLIRAAHDPSRPEAALAVETIIAALDESLKQVAADVAPALEQLSAPVVVVATTREQLLEDASDVGWDTDEGVALRKRAEAIRDEEDEEAERPDGRR